MGCMGVPKSGFILSVKQPGLSNKLDPTMFHDEILIA